MTKNELQEDLVALYLRLNGYFSTGLIIHSADDNNVDGEVDVVGIRFKNHKQEDRIVECSTYLSIPSDADIDVIIGEVKGGKNPLQFNDSLRNHKDRRYKLLTWLGFLNDEDIEAINAQLELIIQTKLVNNSEHFERFDYQSNAGIISIRPILFAPDRSEPRNNQVKFIHGQVMLDFIWACLRPESRRESCETDYWSISNWGRQFEMLVRYFKQPNKENVENIKSLYEYFEV